MEYNDIIKKQLTEYISNPTVLVDKNDAPYEYKSHGSINRLKRRRNSGDIPLQLYSFLIENGVSKNQLREFSGGLILNYTEMADIYN